MPQSLSLATESLSLATGNDMNRCDWNNCLEFGVFDGVQKTLLNAKGRQNIRQVLRKFVFLCPEHFKLGVGTLA
jgi:hypothetical protein